MMNNSDWYPIEEADVPDSPLLLVYPQRVKENIRILKNLVKDPSILRPHIKTSKIKEVALLMMEEGIEKFKCATIAEAEMMGQCMAPDVLLAYQPTRTKLLRFIDLVQLYPQTAFSCLVDNPRSASLFSEIAIEHQLVISVYIDLNVGMNRTGIPTEKGAMELYETIQTMPGLKSVGFHAYDGHLHESALDKRTVQCNASFLSVEKMRNDLQLKGFPFPPLIAGGSPTFQIHALRKHIEVSPGTFVFWDKGYSDSLPEQPFIWAALVLTRVISLPDESKICIDLGYKAIASENELKDRVFFLNAPRLRPVGHSEEHMVIEAGKGHGFKIGDLLYALPFHICPTVALYSQALCIESGTITGSWSVVARDRNIGC